MLKNKVEVDVAIIGGGISGLWLLTRIRQAGFSAILLEAELLGGGQTYKSQGIIHGGLKYALQGVLTREASAMAEMPKRWRACLEGRGDIDLSDVRILSSAQHLWASNKFTAKLAGFFASKTLVGCVKLLKNSEFPSLFQNDTFKGDVYALEEIVLDVPNLIASLIKQNEEVIFKIDPLSAEAMHLLHEQNLQALVVSQNNNSLIVAAKQYIFAAGSGNEIVVNKWQEPTINMQRRPLHMVLVKMTGLPTFYGHCLTLDPRPRVTITTHYTKKCEPVWYLGGLLAEEGVLLSEQQQIFAAKKELAVLFPWLDFSNADWRTLKVDRAEPKQTSGLKPEGSYLKVLGNQLLVWPTKLALTPELADHVLAHFSQINFAPGQTDIHHLSGWPKPRLAKPVWEDAFCKSAS